MRVVIIEPDPMSSRLLEFILTDAGYCTHVSQTAFDAIAAVSGRETDIVLMETDLPDMDGFTLCKELRSRRYTGPVIFVSRRCATQDKLRAFEYGADDYLTVPYHPSELLARIEAVTRRYRQASETIMSTILRVGDAELSVGELTFKTSTLLPVLLTPTEMRILECLMRNTQITITRDTLIERTWGYDLIGDTNRVSVYIRRLRTKIERDPAEPEYLHTVRGIGYVFRPPIRDLEMPLDPVADFADVLATAS